MALNIPVESNNCKDCKKPLDFDFTFAFQPIIDVDSRSIFGYEALVRGKEGQGAGYILDKVNESNRYAFDQACRVTAIRLASELKLDKMLSINFLPNAVYKPQHCIQSTLKAANEFGFPLNNIMFEITESEQVVDIPHLRKIFEYYQSQGFTTALDDFGAGYAGLNVLASFPPQVLKLDMALVQNIHQDKVKQAIIDGMISIADKLNIRLLAEGIETHDEAKYFQQKGVSLMQGYFFAKPGFEILPVVDNTLWEVFD